METILFKDWVDKYRPDTSPDGVRHQYEPGSFMVGLMPHSRVWTLLEIDGTRFILPGFHMVNRVSYYLTDVPWANEHIEVIEVED